jgi:hypothetical protein
VVWKKISMISPGLSVEQEDIRDIRLADPKKGLKDMNETKKQNLNISGTASKEKENTPEAAVESYTAQANALSRPRGNVSH